MTNKRYRLLQIGNTVLFLLMLYVNMLATTLPLNGKTPGELSALYPNLFVPAGITFSIWGVIYILLLGFIVLQLRGLFSGNPPLELLDKVGLRFIVSCLANIGWLLAWHYQRVFLSFLVMLLLLLTLRGIYRRVVNLGFKSIWAILFVNVAFSIYLGWISVATLANLTALLVSFGLNGMGIIGMIWAILMIGLAVYIALRVLKKRGDIFYSAVFIWAFVGIIIKRFSVQDTVWPVIIAALAAIIVVGVSMIREGI